MDSVPKEEAATRTATTTAAEAARPPDRARAPTRTKPIRLSRCGRSSGRYASNRFIAHVTDGGLHHYEVRPLPALPLPVLGVHRAPFLGVAVPVVVRLIGSLQVTISPERKPMGLVSERASGFVAEGGGCSEDYIIGEYNYNGGGGGAGYFRDGDRGRAG